jgi:DNA-directed RNA polymerase subunit RPC12/RpoP
MEGQCLKCGKQLSSPWKFCPECGAAVALEDRQLTAPHVAEKTPVRGAFSGLLFGMIATPILIIVGTMLCLTGLGAFLGIPMIIAGIFAPLLGPLIGFGSLKGQCPWCGSPVSSLRSVQSFDCETCNQRIAFKVGKFVKAT